jgi:PQQ-like domain
MPQTGAGAGGANTGDRSTGGDQGELLLTGAMTVSPDSRYVIVQRNETTVLLNVATKVAKELPFALDRIVFSQGNVAYAIQSEPRRVQALDLATGEVLWDKVPAFISPRGALLAKLSEDGKTLLLGDTGRVFALDTKDGAIRDAVSLGTDPTDIAMVPGKNRALVAGTVAWRDHKPITKIIDIDLATLTQTSVDVPNCHAPLEVLPNAKRAFMSPTFCEEGGEVAKSGGWTNPDPVSIINLSASAPVFVRNLPGFGPVAMPKDGSRVIAYLDRERADEALFDDKSQIPRGSADQFQLMTIDPDTLAFKLAPIGSVLPRFALTQKGDALLVDASSIRTRGAATLKASLSKDGLRLEASLFGNRGDNVFGQFDLASQRYQPFSGAPAKLDRFVQLADGKTIFALNATFDGLGGDLFLVDLADKTSVSLNQSLRDIGLLADGKTVLLRKRLPAASVTVGANVQWYRREAYCFSLDGVTCSSNVEFQDSKPFYDGPVCEGMHDC